MRADLTHIDVNEYPFYKFLNEDKSRYKHAKDCGYIDPDDSFLIGDSGGFLMNIEPNTKFVNTELITAVGRFYDEHKYYLPPKYSKIKAREFRMREEMRRKHGIDVPCLSVNGKIKTIHVTGSNYNFVNYGLIKKLDRKTIKSTSAVKKADKGFGIAEFVDAQYWMFKCFEFAENNGFHIMIDKTRRGGLSYINAIDTANDINLDPSAIVIHVAYDSDYLTMAGGLTSFSIDQLNFYENNTPFIRGIASKVAKNFRLGILQKNGSPHPDSWRSAMLSVSAHNDPNCAIGKDANKVKVEELSTMTNFDAFMTVTEPAMRTGSYTTGTLYCWGTATSGNMQVFELSFYNPNSKKLMPFENVWDKDKRGTVCGLFKPYPWGLQGDWQGISSLDDDGNSNLPIALKIAEKERADYKENNTFDKFINYLGQYAIYPSESFSSARENVFIKPQLLDWERDLQNNPEYNFYTDGHFVMDKKGNVEFVSNTVAEREGLKFGIDWFNYIVNVPRQAGEDPHGCVRMFFPPYREDTVDENGRVVQLAPKGMYSIAYDPVGVDKIKDDITNKHSHNCIHVWENPCRLNNYVTRLCAIYYGRPDTLAEADKICYYLAVYYNCIGTTFVEVNRGETISNFKTWHATKYLKRNPKFIWNDNDKDTSEGEYGVVIGDAKAKLDGIRLAVEMLYTKQAQDEHGEDLLVLNKIYDLQTIVELKKWNAIGNFDRVSTFIIRAIEYKAINTKAERDMINGDIDDDENSKGDGFFERTWC
jgi:hypothetical protein